MAILINGGTYKIADGSWVYPYEDSTGSYKIVFLADVGVVPRIGDSISDGVLVPLVGYKTNNDPGKAQARKTYPQEWPVQNKTTS